MAYHSLERKQILPISIESSWKFFSNPKNLAKITPDNMDFNVTSKIESEHIYSGQIITYSIRPLWGIPMSWVTEINHVNAPYYFVDMQLSGPYKYWHHEHHFKETATGTEMTDILYYELPLGLLGNLAHQLFVKERVEDIFNYRYHKLETLF